MGRLENVIILGDFNCEVDEAAMRSFCETYNLYNLVVGPTCFKNPINPSSIDLMFPKHSPTLLETSYNTNC